MRKLSEKSPVIFEILLFVIAMILCEIGLLALRSFLYMDIELASAIARILVGILLMLVFFRCFRGNRPLKGFAIMLPTLLFALYKIPYQFVSGGGSPVAPTLTLILSGIAPAVFEEVLFRGIFIAKLKKKYHNPLAIVLISAIVFSLVHLTNLAGMDVVTVMIQLLFAFSVGVALGGIYIRTKDLLSVMIAHAIIDIIGGIFPGGSTTPYYFFAIFGVILIVEIVYGLILAKGAKGHQRD